MSENNFIGYEYQTVSSPQSLESVYTDGYQNFGWEMEGSSAPTGRTTSMKFKRDRKIRNKAELTRLQRQFDACVDEIKSMEQSKNVKASIVAYVFGLIGCAFMAGSIFAITAAPPNTILCIILGVPGLIGWIIPYFCYVSIREKKAEAINPLIDKKYDEIYEVCEKANSLLDNG